MLNDHPTAEAFTGFLRNPSQPDRRVPNAQALRHLLADCSICRDRLAMMGWTSSRLESLVHLAGGSYQEIAMERPVQMACDYDQAFSKAEWAVSELLAEAPPQVRSTEKLMAELENIPLEAQAQLLERNEVFANPQAVKRLIDYSHRERYQDLKMLHWAQLAHNLSARCDEKAAGGAAKLADLRARSGGQLGNALRVAGRLPEARETMVKSWAQLRQGTGDPLLRAQLMEQMASLHTFERSFAAAISILDEAAEIYRELGENHFLARTLVQAAIALLYAGQAEKAAETLNNAIPLIDQEEEPHLLLAACHNLVLCYIDLDQPERALELYSQSRELYKDFKDSLILLRSAWQEGRLLRDLGHLRVAETALLRAREGFMERGLAYEVAVVSLDLASVHVRLGALEDLRRTLMETMPIFRSLRVSREALGAIIQLQQVAHQEHQALELIREVTAQLEQLSNRVALRS
jgi:tetratricopeptide (TPR) repeat protein